MPFEHGSVFHTVWPPAGSAEVDHDWHLFGTGRQALRALVSMHSWRRVWVPTYYCHDVTATLRQVCDVQLYEAAPFDDTIDLEADRDEAVVVVEYFGLRSSVTVHGGHVLLDLTHDPGAMYVYERPPDFSFASLRKTLPTPDGGAVWSVTGRELPPEEAVTAEHALAALDMLTGMSMKASYLIGESVSKAAFRSLVQRGEDGLSSGAESGISDWSRWAVSHADFETRGARRRENVASFVDAWCTVDGIEVIATPAYVCLLARSADVRDEVRDGLIARSVYPAILWPLDGNDVPSRHRELSERILLLHADDRYTAADMSRTADLTAQAVSLVAS